MDRYSKNHSQNALWFLSRKHPNGSLSFHENTFYIWDVACGKGVIEQELERELFECVGNTTAFRGSLKVLKNITYKKAVTAPTVTAQNQFNTTLNR